MRTQSAFPPYVAALGHLNWSKTWVCVEYVFSFFVANAPDLIFLGEHAVCMCDSGIMIHVALGGCELLFMEPVYVLCYMLAATAQQLLMSTVSTLCRY